MVMEDLAAKLSELLESPDGLETVKSLAGALLNNQSGGKDGADESPLEKLGAGGGLDALGGLDSLGGLFSSISPNELQAMIKVGNALKSNQQDDRSRLLLALKPHLSTQRQGRVDQAVKILRLISVLPIISEQGLFKDLF